MKQVKALVPTGYGLNCDYETLFCLRRAGAEADPIHINDIIAAAGTGEGQTLSKYDILVLGGGFSWADDHGAGVLMASKLKHHLGDDIDRFIQDGKLIVGICNGFQVLVNLGLLPGFDGNYTARRIALIGNDSGNFIDTWVKLKVEQESCCVYMNGISEIELPVRHGEGKFYASDDVLDLLEANKQVVLRYADQEGNPAGGRRPANPNGSIHDIAGICDPTGRIFGLMPHPEAFNHFTNHPCWTRIKESDKRRGITDRAEEGDGIAIFRNAVRYVMNTK
ncbi:MAG TPA: phosphoribosylformylglycinamidine synthase I [Desulfobacteraceae bacterium]|nr:phosphoribosylformylglycinamidine synthase I [Desulfobacteraceae bacterium]